MEYEITTRANYRRDFRYTLNHAADLCALSGIRTTAPDPARIVAQVDNEHAPEWERIIYNVVNYGHGYNVKPVKQQSL